MSEMKCPFCNGELVGTIGHPICRNQDCVMCDDPMPQDLLEELIRTRKALDVAVDALKEISLRYSDEINAPERVWSITAIDMAEYADTALEQITALEGKMKTDKEKNKNPYETAEIGYWKARNKLTEEKLDIAVDALKEYADRDNWGMGFAPWLEDGFKDALYTEDGYKTAEKALDQITELEQKDK